LVFAKKFIPKSPTSGGKFLMSSPKINLTNGRFKYIDEELTSPIPVDYSNINATVTDFDLKTTIVNLHIEDLSLNSQTGYVAK